MSPLTSKATHALRRTGIMLSVTSLLVMTATSPSSTESETAKEPFDLDGNPGVLSTAEHAAIQTAWLSVREELRSVQRRRDDGGSRRGGSAYTFSGDTPVYVFTIFCGLALRQVGGRRTDASQ